MISRAKLVAPSRARVEALALTDTSSRPSSPIRPTIKMTAAMSASIIVKPASERGSRRRSSRPDEVVVRKVGSICIPPELSVGMPDRVLEVQALSTRHVFHGVHANGDLSPGTALWSQAGWRSACVSLLIQSKHFEQRVPVALTPREFEFAVPGGEALDTHDEPFVGGLLIRGEQALGDFFDFDRFHVAVELLGAGGSGLEAARAPGAHVRAEFWNREGRHLAQTLRVVAHAVDDRRAAPIQRADRFGEPLDDFRVLAVDRGPEGADDLGAQLLLFFALGGAGTGGRAFRLDLQIELAHAGFVRCPFAHHGVQHGVVGPEIGVRRGHVPRRRDSARWSKPAGEHDSDYRQAPQHPRQGSHDVMALSHISSGATRLRLVMRRLLAAPRMTKMACKSGLLGDWCNGNMGVSKTLARGSIPRSPALRRLRISDELTIPLAEVTVRASRSSGPGGQHANVTASRVEASFDVL